MGNGVGAGGGEVGDAGFEAEEKGYSFMKVHICP